MVKSLTPELPTSQMQVPSPQDWTLLREEKDTRTRYTLTTQRGERHVVCPTSEASVVNDVLMGREYPIPEPIQALILGMPIVDIGAHVGSANVYFDELLHPSRIISCEPHPENVEYLRANTNGVTSILPAAVIDHELGATLSTPIWESGDKAMSCATLHFSPSESVEKIEVPTLHGWDVLAVERDEIGLLKIDAEYAELRILCDAVGELPRVWVVIIEYHSEVLRRQCDMLLGGYELFFVRGNFRQGVAGYLRSDLAAKFPVNVHF